MGPLHSVVYIGKKEKQKKGQKEMELHVEPINDKNRESAVQLKTGPGQEHFVEDVKQCLSEADSNPCWRPVGIYDGSTLVGFAMYGYFREYRPEGRVWLDRLLIDRHFQGNGYGTEALRMLLGRLSGEYGCSRIYLSIIEENETAAKLYEKFGFRFSGERDINDEKVMVLELPA